ncbi:MAG TPA: DUF418 domain-containing protein [Bacteroidales bacterium]|nr:DUF418 domain-containing protein [Bacteroidales bacterium]
MQQPNTNRIEVVDALRGFAIMSIMLLHHLEHFDFWFFPENLPAWLKVVDGAIWKTMFFLFSGKAYTIFALLFGFTFFIMFNKQQQNGKGFRLRFVWRMFLLLGFGFINSLFYEGDILTFYAVLGVSLVLVCKWNNKAVLITAIILLLQPIEMFRLGYAIFHPEYTLPARMSDPLFGKIGEYLSAPSFWGMLKGNITNGKMAVIYWNWENGRIFQAPALFMLGMLLGRKGYFSTSDANQKFWKKVLFSSIATYLILGLIAMIMKTQALTPAVSDKTFFLLGLWSNVAFTFFWVSLFYILYHKKAFSWLLQKLRPFGKMSLSNYVIQSLVGSFIYYGYGLGLYQYTGATYCLLIGIVLFVLQLWFCKWWLSRFKQGPLEGLWHKGTWVFS